MMQYTYFPSAGTDSLAALALSAAVIGWVWGSRNYLAAAMRIQIPIVNPIPILRPVETTRPMGAPFATRVASPADDPRVSSAMSAPMNDPRNAPIMGPTIGTGTPTIAPTILPIMAPQPARRDPPYFRAFFPVRDKSNSSAMKARIPTAARLIQPIGSPGTTML